MLDINSNYQNIINVKDPIQPQDAATKHYVDILGTVFTINLTGTTSTLLSNQINGSFYISVTNNVSNGPCAIFNILKNDTSNCPNITRTVSAIGPNGPTQLQLSWNPYSSIYLYKNTSYYDGSYLIKMI